MLTYLLEGLTTVCDYNLPSISYKTKFRQNIIMNNIKEKTLGLKIAKQIIPIQNNEMAEFIGLKCADKKLHINNPYNFATI